MTHREFLVWLKPRLESAAKTGLPSDGVRAIRDQLAGMRSTGVLQPFASRLAGLIEHVTTLDGPAVASLAAELRAEIAPARERTVVGSSSSDDDDP